MNSIIQKFLRQSRKRRRLLSGLLLVCMVAALLQCTTQDFEYAGRVDTVYRVKLKNIGSNLVTYATQTTLFYIGGKDSSAVRDSLTIAPGDPEKLLVESKQGAYGISSNVFIQKSSSKLRMTLEKGKGVGDHFKLDTVVVVKTSTFDLGVRDGEVH